MHFCRYAKMGQYSVNSACPVAVQQVLWKLIDRMNQLFPTRQKSLLIKCAVVPVPGQFRNAFGVLMNIQRPQAAEILCFHALVFLTIVAGVCVGVVIDDLDLFSDDDKLDRKSVV